MNLEEMVKKVEEEFANGRTKRVPFRKMIRKLEEKGIGDDDIDDALHEAQRRKITRLQSGFYEWIDPNIRGDEKAKTQRYFEVLAEIFKYGKIDFLPKGDVKAALRARGFDDKEVGRAIIEAERDYVLTFYSWSPTAGGDLVAGCNWIPPEERKMEAEAEKFDREFLRKWYEKDAMQEKMWPD